MSVIQYRKIVSQFRTGSKIFFKIGVLGREKANVLKHAGNGKQKLRHHFEEYVKVGP